MNVTTDGKSWALAFATHPSATHPGRTDFALCYNEQHDGNAALACAQAAAAAGGAEKVMAERNSFILTLPALRDPADDRFQRKLLSVMKVNSMSPEGSVAHNWSTTCRAPHKWMVTSYFLVFVPTIREIQDFYREMQRTNRESITCISICGMEWPKPCR
eukprot:SAG31_NODE_2319_length_5944_cov_9.686056_6_plen_159_part_00